MTTGRALAQWVCGTQLPHGNSVMSSLQSIGSSRDVAFARDALITRDARHAFRPALHGAVFGTLVALSVAAPAAAGAEPSPFATSWISYSAGAGVPPSFQNPNAALGQPTRFSGVGVDPGVVSPFQPAFMPSEIVSIGPGGSLVLAFDHDVIDDPDHPFGVDLLVFGNAFFEDIVQPTGVTGILFAEGGLIEVSEDGVAWQIVPGAEAEGMYPTLGYLDAEPYDLTAGAVPSDFTKPVDPAAAEMIVEGTTFEELLELYDGSGGGTCVDLAAAGVAKARYVRIRVPAGACCTVEIDAVSAVKTARPKFEVADINRDGVVDGNDLAILLGGWGTDGSLPRGATADLNDDGTVNGNDLAILLGSWN